MKICSASDKQGDTRRDSSESLEGRGEVKELFEHLLTEHERAVCIYVLTLVPNRTDVDDILQNTKLVLWKEFREFHPGSNFRSWACKVAFNQVLAWRKKRQRDRLRFSEAFYQAVADEAVKVGSYLDDRSELLSDCIAKLPSQQQELLQMRYQGQCNVESLALQQGSTVAAVYRRLSRIRRMLRDCVTRKIAV